MSGSKVCSEDVADDKGTVLVMVVDRVQIALTKASYVGRGEGDGGALWGATDTAFFCTGGWLGSGMSSFPLTPLHLSAVKVLLTRAGWGWVGECIAG